MLIPLQYYKIIILYILLFYSWIFCNENYHSNWGFYSISNNSLNIKNHEITPIINQHINDMNLILGPIEKSFFKIIIKSDNIQYNNIFNWSLGITQGNKIIIKDPSISHIKRDKFYEVLKHELNHIYLNRISNKNYIPRWFKEGFCMYYANESSLRNKLVFLSSSILLGRLDKLLRLFLEISFSLASINESLGKRLFAQRRLSSVYSCAQ